MSDIYFTFISIFPPHKSQNYDLVVLLLLRLDSHKTIVLQLLCDLVVQTHRHTHCAQSRLWTFLCLMSTSLIWCLSFLLTSHFSTVDSLVLSVEVTVFCVEQVKRVHHKRESGDYATLKCDRIIQIYMLPIVCASSIHVRLIKFVPLLSFWRHICIVFVAGARLLFTYFVIFKQEKWYNLYRIECIAPQIMANKTNCRIFINANSFVRKTNRKYLFKSVIILVATKKQHFYRL